MGEILGRAPCRGKHDCAALSRGGAFGDEKKARRDAWANKQKKAEEGREMAQHGAKKLAKKKGIGVELKISHRNARRSEKGQESATLYVIGRRGEDQKKQGKKKKKKGLRPAQFKGVRQREEAYCNRKKRGILSESSRGMDETLHKPGGGGKKRNG